MRESKDIIDYTGKGKGHARSSAHAPFVIAVIANLCAIAAFLLPSLGLDFLDDNILVTSVLITCAALALALISIIMCTIAWHRRESYGLERAAFVLGIICLCFLVVMLGL